MPNQKGTDISQKPHALLLAGNLTIVEFEIASDGIKTLTFESQSQRFMIAHEDFNKALVITNVTGCDDNEGKDANDDKDALA